MIIGGEPGVKFPPSSPTHPFSEFSREDKPHPPYNRDNRLSLNRLRPNGLCVNDRQGIIDFKWLERAEMVLVQARRLRAMLQERAAKEGLGEPELALLWACVASPPGGRGQRELAEFLAVSTAQISVLVERLDRAGLLQDRLVPGDRRRRLWEPTAAGVALWRSIAESFNDLEPHREAA